MDSFLLIALLIFGFVILPIGIGLLLYFIPKRLGYPKTAKYLTLVYSVFLFLLIGFYVFEDQLFTKRNAKDLVEEQGVVLSDDFELTENKSSSAIGDYYHTFTLKISPTDRAKAIEKIRSSTNFTKASNEIDDLQFSNIDRYKGPKRIQNYETESGYVREYFKPSGKEGYAPTFRRILISKNTNELTFEDIVE